MTHRTLALALTALGALSACTGSQAARVQTAPPRAAAPAPQIRGDEFRIVGRADGTGDAYDATLLFERANAAVRVRRCEAALEDYERLVREFPHSRLVAASQFNRGVCLQSMGRHDDAIAAYREAVELTADPTLARDALFRIAVVGEATQRPPVVVEAANSLLGRRELTIADRVEALARLAAAQLAQGDRPTAQRTAEQAMTLVPTAEAVSALGDDTFIAQARFVAAEVSRLDAEAIAVNVEDANLERAIERRVQLVTRAHVQYNDAIRIGNPHWAAACGFSIGQMYRSLYEAIVNAPVPADWDANAVAVYRRRTGERLRPLLTGALRAWEATQAMARRNGISDNDWVRQTDTQIGSLRDLILNSGRDPAPAHQQQPAQPQRPASGARPGAQAAGAAARHAAG